MSSYETVAQAEHVVGGYVKAHDELREHERTGSEAALRRAAADLCDALTRLETDDAFWHEIAHVAWPSSRLPERLHDVDSLLGVERDVLIEAGVPPGAVDEILRDAGVALNAYAEWPDEFIRQLASARGASHSRASRVLGGLVSIQARRQTRRLRRAVLAAAGGVIIVANGRVALAGVTDLSIVVGEIVIVYSSQPETDL